LQEDITLREIEDWVNIGMLADIKQDDVPKPIPIDPVVIKKQRDVYYKENLAMVAMYNETKKTNPQLDFSSYLDSIESTKPSA